MKKLTVILAVAGMILAAGSGSYADISFHHGTSTGVHHSAAGGATAYKSNADSIEADTFTSQVDFTPEQCAHWGVGYLEGMDIYIQGMVSGLSSGDVVKVDNNYLWRESSSGTYESFWDQDPYWVLIGNYTHATGDDVVTWLTYVNNNGDGTYSMEIGSGEYWLVEGNETSDAAQLKDLVGMQMKLTRDISVYTGATLQDPATSWRGYTYSATGITGGSESASTAYDTGDFTTIAKNETELFNHRVESGDTLGSLGWTVSAEAAEGSAAVASDDTRYVIQMEDDVGGEGHDVSITKSLTFDGSETWLDVDLAYKFTEAGSLKITLDGETLDTITGTVETYYLYYHTTFDVDLEAGSYDLVITLYSAGGDPDVFLDNIHASVPEPGTMVLLGLGGLGVLIRRKRNVPKGRS